MSHRSPKFLLAHINAPERQGMVPKLANFAKYRVELFGF